MRRGNADGQPPSSCTARAELPAVIIKGDLNSAAAVEERRPAPTDADPGGLPEKIRPTIFGSAGCKAVFGGVDPATAEEFSKWFGETWITETTTSRGLQTGQSEGRGHSHDTILDPQVHSSQSSQTTQAANQSMSTRMVERAVWTPSDIMMKVPTGHSVVALAATDGQRVGPLLVNHRAAIRQVGQ